jgi:Transcriptional regulator, AbiEi antitoxin/Protein of unknown function (DUF559)
MGRVPTSDEALIRIARGQLGAFSRAQAHAVGMTDDRLRHRVRQGWLERVGPNAFRLPGSGGSAASRLYGLVLDVGGPCFAFGPTAAALHRLDGFELVEPFHVVIQRGRQVRRAGHEIHTSEYLPESDLTMVDSVPTTRVPRTLIDLARVVDRTRLTAAYDAAVRDRRVDEDALAARLNGLVALEHPLPGSKELLAVIDGSEAERGAHSFLERRFLELMAERGLPAPDTQRVLGRRGDRLIRVDFRFPGTNVVVEVLGHRYHRSREQMAIDAERMNELVAHGYRPYQFTYEHVIEQPDRVVVAIEHALRGDAA